MTKTITETTMETIKSIVSNPSLPEAYKPKKIDDAMLLCTNQLQSSALLKARLDGKFGWHLESVCTIVELKHRMLLALDEGRYVDAQNYLSMIIVREGKE